MPISEEKIILLLTYKKKMGATFNTIITLQRCLCAYCLYKELGDFSKSTKIHKFISGLNRDMNGASCPYAVTGFTKEMLLEIEKRVNKNNIFELRDLCTFTLCFEGMLRASELLSLKNEDLLLEGNRIKVHLKKSKTDQLGVGRNIYIYEHNSPISAFRCLQMYLKHRINYSKELDFLFISKTGKRLSDRNYRDRIKKWVEILGLDPAEYSTHSFRVGSVECATKSKVPPAAIKQQGGWKSNCFLRYARITEEEASELVQDAFK